MSIEVAAETSASAALATKACSLHLAGGSLWSSSGSIQANLASTNKPENYH